MCIYLGARVATSAFEANTAALDGLRSKYGEQMKDCNERF